MQYTARKVYMLECMIFPNQTAVTLNRYHLFFTYLSYLGYYDVNSHVYLECRRHVSTLLFLPHSNDSCMFKKSPVCVREKMKSYF